MQAERWRQVEKLFYSILERSPDERAAHLDEACAGDEELRREVGSLLAVHAQGGSLLETPAADLAAEWAKDQSTRQFGQQFGRTLGHFRILSLLGRGGMGEVYLAEDKLRRKVALKLLPKEFAGQPDRLRRFEQEARAASALNHPNIVIIYEIDQASPEEGGAHFIAAEFVEGQTLRVMMRQERMKIETALDMAAQAASALEAAHVVGIIHRDVKPENLMVRNDGLVKVLDFGLAKLTRPQPANVDTRASTAASVGSAPGVVMGTATYMSPEQARGLEVDARTDIFSLGVVLYEMIAGRAPFEGATTSDVIAAILTTDPVPLGERAPETPPDLERIVNRALKKDREERYQTIVELHRDLEALRQGAARDVSLTALASPLPRVIKRHPAVFAVLAIALVALICLGFYWRLGRSAQEIDSIAIMPFANVSADPNAQYLADGIPASLINKLTRLPALRVLPRSTTFRYKNKEFDPVEVGRKLGVRAVLIGKVAQMGDNLNIEADLVDVARNAQLWSEQYRRNPSDILSVQEEITNQVVRELRLNLSGEEQRQLAERPTENAEAYRLYWQGRFHWNRYNENDFRKSIEYFEKALERDRHFALAYVGLADAYSSLGIDHVRPREVFPWAKQYAEKALELDDRLAEAHNSLGVIKLFYEWDWPGAQRAFARARDLNPRNADVGHFYGHYFEAMGNLREGIRETQRGVDLEPESIILNAELGFAYYWARDYDRAIAQHRKTLDLFPNSAFAKWALAQALEQKQMNQEAVNELLQVRQRAGGWSFLEAELACALARAGKKDEARRILTELRQRAAQKWVDPGVIALVHIELGEKDQAFEWLEKTYEERTQWMLWLKIEPKFDPLRADPRFKALLRRVKLLQ